MEGIDDSDSDSGSDSNVSVRRTTPRLREVRRESVGERWEVVLRIENVGDGRVPVDVAAVAGEPFDDRGHPEPGYRDVRRSVTLGAGESRELRIQAGFEPERVVVDPDVQVLQLRRGGGGGGVVGRARPKGWAPGAQGKRNALGPVSHFDHRHLPAFAAQPVTILGLVVLVTALDHRHHAH